MMGGFPEIRLKKIISFYDMMISVYEPTLRNVRARYERVSNDFDSVLQFLLKINMLKIVEDEIKLKCLNQFRSNDIDSVKSQIVQELVNPTNQISKYLDDYLGNFTFRNERYIHYPSIDERLFYSKIRNLLIELNVIGIGDDGFFYYIHPKFTSLFSKFFGSVNGITPEQLKNIHLNNERIGALAELFILDYEKGRLRHYPGLKNKIEHVALKSVSAGYDILSFEIPSIPSVQKKRHIEVKAVSPNTYHFFMSNREMEVASELGQEYCLYLVPVLSNETFDIHNLKIINEPMTILFQDEDKWHVEIENLSFQMI
jgi:hypothetical protein